MEYYYKWYVCVVTSDGRYLTDFSISRCKNKGACIKSAKRRADKIILYNQHQNPTTFVESVCVKVYKVTETKEEVYSDYVE